MISFTSWRPCFILVFISLIFISAGLSVAPSPQCHVKPLFKNAPVFMYETIYGDLSDSFSGFNLDFEVQVPASVRNTTILPKKLQQYPALDYSINGLQTHFLQNKRNGWGSHLHILANQLDFTVLYLYTIANATGSPKFEAAVLVENQKNTYCFDSAVFLDHGKAIVDCAEKTGDSWRNVFVYVDLSTRVVYKKVPNELYVEFKQIKDRKFRRYVDPQTGYEYVVRVHLAGGVDTQNSANTYLELFSALDLQDLQIIRIIDRTQIGRKQLAIVDFKIYLGDIFVLDYYFGLMRFDISAGQHIVFMGHYKASYFTKFSIYSDDLEEQILVALSNSHSVHQIDWNFEWGRKAEPKLIQKYSLMPNSHVRDIIVTNKYLVVQSSSNSTSDQNRTKSLNYTWIFNRQTRSYTKAFKIISHSSEDVLIDFDRENDYLLTMDRQGIRHFKVNRPLLEFMSAEQSTLGTSFNLTISATSTSPEFQEKASCGDYAVVHVVTPDNMTIWPSGWQLPATYYTNYPGRLQIPLQAYVIGPNVSYSLQETLIHHDLPNYWVNQQNESRLHIDKPPIITQIKFFYTEVLPHESNDTILYFYQTMDNIVHVARCDHSWEAIDVYCTVVAQHSLNSKIHQFRSALFWKDEQLQFYYIWTLQGAPNVVYITDFMNHRRTAVIQMPEGFEGYVGDIDSSNGILFITLKYMKTIVAYRLAECADFTCPISFSIDSHTLKPLGVRYFAPVQIVTSRVHPQVLFIKCLGEVLILDVDNKNRLVVLQQIFTSARMGTTYKLAVNRRHMIIVSANEQLIQSYSIENIYQKRIALIKYLPIYNYTLPQDFDLEFSDVGELFYVSAVDTATNLSTILVYNPYEYGVAGFYDVINLPGRYPHANLEIQVSGYLVDYVSVIASGQFYFYRQYQQPFLVVQDTLDDFQFYIHFSNHQTSQNLSLVNVKVANYPQNFTATEEFQNVIKPTLKVSQNGTHTWDTHYWFTGHIINYNYTCQQCDKDLRLKSHVQYQRVLPFGGYDFTETLYGGMSVWEDLLLWRPNGSIYQIVNIPDPKEGEKCIKVVATPDDLFAVTGCETNQGQVNIYLVSTVSTKGFTVGPFETSAMYLRNLQMVNQLLVLTDVDNFPQHRFRSGGIFIYAMNMDFVSEDQFQQIDLIDSNDFYDAPGWQKDQDAYIGNSHLIYDEDDDIYRLYATQIDNGLFILDFKYNMGQKDLTILQTHYVDLNAILQKLDFHMPNDALFLAVAHLGSRDHPIFETQHILVTTQGYHNFEFKLIYNGSKLLQTVLERVYYRYAYFILSNYLKVAGDYFAVSYIVPAAIADINPNISAQIIAVYDTTDYPHESEKGYSQRWILGAHTIKHTGQVRFGFNTTFDRRSDQAKIGLVIIDTQNNIFLDTSLSHNISLSVPENFKNQVVKVTPYSDFSAYTFDLDIYGPHPQPTPSLAEWKIILIVIGTILSVGVLGYVVFFIYKRTVSHSSDGTEPENQVPLLDQEPNSQTEPQNQMVINQSIAESENLRLSVENNAVVSQVQGALPEAVQQPNLQSQAQANPIVQSEV